MEYFKILPIEITMDILTRVPTEFVLNCKLVCTTWRSLVRRQSFSKMHFHHLNHPSTIDSGKLGFIALTGELDYQSKIFKLWYLKYNENHNQSTTPIQRIMRINITPPPWRRGTILCSCNGLICISGDTFSEPKTDIHVCIFNPITREYVVLPEIKTDFKYTRTPSTGCGFGYPSSTNEYKFLLIYNRWPKLVAYIYTLGSGDGWRNLGNFSCEFKTYSPPVYANGALYWMKSNTKMIVTFDLAEEKFHGHLAPPPLPPKNKWYCNRMGILDGFLYFAVGLVVGLFDYYDVWLLRKEVGDHGMKEKREEHQSWGWKKEFRIEKSKLVAVTKTGGALTYTKFTNYIEVCDTKNSTSKKLVDFKKQWIREACSHKNSLVSLKELGEENSKIMEPIEIEETENHDQPSFTGK